MVIGAQFGGGHCVYSAATSKYIDMLIRCLGKITS